MRHNYATKGIVLARYPVAEASAHLALMTHELGIVRARAQGVRKAGAKLAPALQTLAESSLVLLRGRDGWRISGAVLDTNWYVQLTTAARMRAGRVTSLLLRLSPGESIDDSFYPILHGFLEALRDQPESLHDAAECLVALRILHALGLDAGEIPAGNGAIYSDEVLRAVEQKRDALVVRINNGINASGL